MRISLVIANRGFELRVNEPSPERDETTVIALGLFWRNVWPRRSWRIGWHSDGESAHVSYQKWVDNKTSGWMLRGPLVRTW